LLVNGLFAKTGPPITQIAQILLSYRLMPKLVAIVGRPNVGKSTLFNRLIGERRSIVGDEPGITRDRIYGEVEWGGKQFSLIDTGGIVPDDDAVIPANILKQAGMAIDEAEVLIWVVDARAGVTQLDEELAALLRSTGKHVVVAANKTDSTRLESDSGEFYRFGFDEVVPVSAEQGIGVGDLLDGVVELVAQIAEPCTRRRLAASTCESDLCQRPPQPSPHEVLHPRQLSREPWNVLCLDIRP